MIEGNSISLLDYMKQAEHRANILKHHNIENLTQEKFGRIMHDDTYDEEAKQSIAKAVEEAGGYECLAHV